MQLHMARMLAERDEWPFHCYGMSPYRNREALVVFWGGYANEMPVIEKHRGRAIVVWRGNDLADNGHHLDVWRREGWLHVATSRWHENDLRSLKLPFIRANLPGRDISSFTYVPAGSKVFFYSGDGETYGDAIFAEVKERLPDIDFVEVLGWYNRTREEMRALMSECFLGLRLRSYDGPASTVLEMASMGRRTVFNGDTPGAIPWADVDEVVAAIKHSPRDADPSLAFAIKDWVNLNSDWYQDVEPTS